MKERRKQENKLSLLSPTRATTSVSSISSSVSQGVYRCFAYPLPPATISSNSADTLSLSVKWLCCSRELFVAIVTITIPSTQEQTQKLSLIPHSAAKNRTYYFFCPASGITKRKYIPKSSFSWQLYVLMQFAIGHISVQLLQRNSIQYLFSALPSLQKNNFISDGDEPE